MTASPAHFISVIVPTYSRPLSLRRCIASLASQRYPPGSFEVIVVDDGGDPPAARALSSEPPRSVQILLIHQPHQGAAVARMAGIARARGQVLAFLDDDCSVPPDYLGAIDRVFQTHPETQVVQVKLDNAEPDNIYGQAWKFALEEALKVNLHPAPGERLVCGILGGVMVARRDVFTEVSFDTMLNRAREDADLLYRLRLRNIPVYYEPQIRVFNHCRRTLGSYLAQYFGYGRGEFHLRRKWGAIPPPSRYVSLVSWRQLRALLKAEGVSRGLPVYGALWLKRHAGLCGRVYEAAAWRFPQRPVCRWGMFSWLLLTTYGRRAAGLCRRILRQVRATLPSRGRQHLPGSSSDLKQPSARRV